MFYTQLLMNKRGPLAKIWLAAHWDKKLKKSHIFECNLEKTIENMLCPKFKLALRTSGHLLLGVVRIYHRKTKYLLSDCNEALLKMQSAFRPGLVDLPEGNLELNYDAITLPEVFHDFDTQLPEVNAIDVAEHFTLNQSRAEDITLLEEDYRQDLLLHGDSFGEEIEMPRQHGFLNDSTLASSGGLLTDYSFLSFTEDKTAFAEDAHSFKYDGFGDEGSAGDMIDAVLGAEPNDHVITDLNMEEEFSLLQELPTDNTAGHPRSEQEARSCQINETTLLLSEEEGFVLEPLDSSVLTRKQRGKKKRKLLVDYVNQLSRKTMQNQLTDYEDTLTELDIAPPTRRLMILQDLGSADKLLGRPTQTTINEDLQKLFAKSLRYGRKRLQELAVERSKEQDFQELPTAGVSKAMQDTTYQFVSQSSGEEKGNKEIIEPMETVGGASTTSDCSSRETSVRLEVEGKQAAVEKGNKDNAADKEEKDKKAVDLLNTFRDMYQTGAKSFSFLTLCKNKTKKEVADKFFSLLVLKKQRAIEVAQAAPYADIVVTVGPNFHTF
ncbi:double-strand-break repair protein rad21-like protein 1 [Lacerta agilis]|uniref:double-strand-break repair protein rad21-like protein 1 n=1 Tax=Lacerta agilis TaxID=80427 RepID=UPI00141A59B0|nr:double-strand-break repair protein rad21-like protein 1 [Lacerta agilis]XP_033009714.1 double-strand-break repair protein rad21-like protein 1 [Lacerta agilis]